MKQSKFSFICTKNNEFNDKKFSVHALKRKFLVEHGVFESVDDFDSYSESTRPNTL